MLIWVFFKLDLFPLFKLGMKAVLRCLIKLADASIIMVHVPWNLDITISAKGLAEFCSLNNQVSLYQGSFPYISLFLG